MSDLLVDDDEQRERHLATIQRLGIPGLFDVHTHFLPPRVTEKVRAVFASAGLLTHSWNQRLWRRVSELVVAGVPEVPHRDRMREVNELRRPRRLASSQMDQVVDDYLSGMSSKAVGKKHGIDGQTVLNNLHVRGVTPRPRTKAGVPNEKLVEAVSLREQGWTWVELGHRYGCSRTAARNGVLRVRPASAEQDNA